MARHGMKTRQALLDAAYELFYRDGFAGVGVDRVAASAGVTKRTLYYHFKSKDTLVAAMLEHQHELAAERIEQWAHAPEGSVQQSAEALFAEVRSWAAQPGWCGSGFSRAAVELASLPGHPAWAATRRHKKAVEHTLGRMFATSGVRDEEAARWMMILLEGAMTLALIHGEKSYFDAAAEAAVMLLEPPGSGKTRSSASR